MLAVNQANAKATEKMAMAAFLAEGKDCAVYFSSSGAGQQVLICHLPGPGIPM